MKTLLMMGYCTATLLAVAGAYDFDTENGKFTYAYPYYVVDVGEASNRFAAVSGIVKVASETAEPTTVDYAEFSSATSGTLFKKGAGWLEIDTEITNWGGQIHVLEGYLLSRCYGSLGAQVLETRSGQQRAARSAGTYVHNGATLVRFNTIAGAVNDTDKKYIAAEGVGADGLGALRCIDLKGSESTWPLGFDTEFLGDTLVKGGPGWPIKLSWYPNPGSTFWLNKNTVTLEGTDGSSGFMHNWGTIHPGHLVLTNIQGRLYGTLPHFFGGPDYTLTLRAQSSLDFTGTVCGDDTTWTLVADGASYIGVNKALADCTNRYNWAGPVHLKTDLPLYSDAGAESCLTLGGYVYGSGGFPVRPKTNKGTGYLNFHLVCPTNAFKGVVGLDRGARLHLHSDGALPLDSAGASVTNGALVLYDVDYRLPPLMFDGTGSVDTVCSYWTNRVCQSLTKTGEGTLCLNTPLHSPLLTIRGGGVRMPQTSFAGFFEGLLPGDPKEGASPVMYTRNVGTNAIVLVADRPNTSWPKCTCLTYSGYIWNRSATNETWTFMTYAGNGGYMFFDDEDRTHLWNRYSTCGDMFANSTTGAWHTVTATPGPHYFEVRYYSAIGSAGGNQASRVKALGDPDRKGTITMVEGSWPDAKGLVWDRQGRGVANPAFFEPIADPGDGSVVTYTTNVVEEAMRQQPRFDAIAAEPGTWLDVAGLAYSVSSLSGFLSVSNCSLFTVSANWTVSADQIAAGGTLTATKLVFAEGVPFTVSDMSTLVHGTYTVARTESGIEGLPTFDRQAQGAKKWHLRKDAEGKALVLEYVPGTTLLLR